MDRCKHIVEIYDGELWFCITTVRLHQPYSKRTFFSWWICSNKLVQLTKKQLDDETQYSWFAEDIAIQLYYLLVEMIKRCCERNRSTGHFIKSFDLTFS
ncbi:hypothetical protein A7K91_13880 [Paenibacillus oryzae]|uniref:Uncharacterized protein n=1 Tax=Paenibacillus oryzae TaxID=1844972 RepID=A0A1A5YJ90_9BACL|nr:hypothetical protein A7K91_13880 [Paenibacillus oryzae]